MLEDHYTTPRFDVSIMNSNISIEPHLVRVAWTFRGTVHHLLLIWWCIMR